MESKKTSTKPRRVVVTGMGVVSSLGHDADTFYANLLDGKSGVSEIENFDCKEFPTVIHISPSMHDLFLGSLNYVRILWSGILF